MPKKSSSKKLKPVKHAEIWKDMTVVELLKEYKKVGFNGKELAKARDVMKTMFADKDCIKFATLAGAIVPGGLKKLIETLEQVDVL